MKIAVLAVQGAFIEHKTMLQNLGIECIELRQKADLRQQYDGLILPGGESTVQGKLIKELDMFEHLQKQIKEGMPVLATCAGLILLSEKISNDDKVHLQTLPVTVKRNAYGRQLGSFTTEEEIVGVGKFAMKFIRAPYVEKVEADVDVLSKVVNHIVMVKYKNQIGLAFHPELTKDDRIHKYFLQMV